MTEVKPPTISKIELSAEDLDKLNKIFNSKKLTRVGKEHMQNRIIGFCSICGAVPDYIITRYYEGMQKIERLCANCLQQ